MDTNKAQLNSFDVYFKQSVGYFKTHLWSFVGLYLFGILLNGVIAMLFFLPTAVLGFLSVTARGATLDVYLSIGVLCLVLLILALTYMSTVFTKSYYLIVDEKMSALHAFEKSFATSGSLFKTRFLYGAVAWGYILTLLIIGGVLSGLSYSVGTPVLVLSLFILIPLFLVSFLVLAYFKFAEYITLSQGITGINALAESYRLVKNNFLGIWGRSFVLAIIVIGISMLVSMLVTPLTLLGTFSESFSLVAYFVRIVSNTFVQLIGGMLTFTFLYAMYKDILEKKPRPEVYAPAGKPFLYIFATVGFIAFIGIFAAIGIGSKVFIEKDGFKQIQRFFEEESKNPNLMKNKINNGEVDVNYNINTNQQPVYPKMPQ